MHTNEMENKLYIFDCHTYNNFSIARTLQKRQCSLKCNNTQTLEKYVTSECIRERTTNKYKNLNTLLPLDTKMNISNLAH